MPVSLTAGNRITEQFFTVNGYPYILEVMVSLYHPLLRSTCRYTGGNGWWNYHFPRIQRKKDLMYYSF